jgi:3-carboxy-cis,cis-muconate cycloisomerase
MSPSSSSSDPFAFLVGVGPVAELTSARAWTEALLEVEAALAGAQGEVGDVTPAAAADIARACDVRRFDVDGIVTEAALGGNLVIPLVARLRAVVGPETAGSVHRAATSQDIVDTATAVIVRRCAGAVSSALWQSSEGMLRLERTAGMAPMIARTLGQHAVPTTFATVTSRWRDGLTAAAGALDRTARPPVWLGGPSGDGTSFGPHREAITRAFARRLELDVAPASQHAQRTWIGDLAGAWGTAAAACAKVALDVVVLSQDDIGELGESAEGSGGSSSMAHKHNPIAAISARAAAMQVPGLVSTLLTAAGSGEGERAAGAWHAEWPALRALLRSTGSAAHWLGTSVDRLHVDTDRMAANLAAHEARTAEAP